MHLPRSFPSRLLTRDPRDRLRIPYAADCCVARDLATAIQVVSPSSSGARLPRVLAVVDRDAVQPRAQTGFRAKAAQILEGFQEDVVRGILRLRRFPEDTQREVVDGLGVLPVNGTELRRTPLRWLRRIPIGIHRD